MSILAIPSFLLVKMALAVWLGAVVFLSFVAAPTVFRTLEPPHSSNYLERLFPRYYALGELCAGLAVVGFVGEWLSGVVATLGARQIAFLAVTAAGGVAFRFSRSVLTPRINAARGRAKAADATPEEAALFKRLHHRSVRINVVVLLGLILLNALH